MTGRFGFVSVDREGKAQRAYFLNGTALSCGKKKLTLSEGQTALKVTSVEGRTLRLAEDVPEEGDIIGSYVLVGETGYEIESTTARSITVRDYPAVECCIVILLNAVESVGER